MRMKTKDKKGKEDKGEINICHPHTCTAEKTHHSIKVDFFFGACLKDIASI
jgi:hypothetical protein